MPPRFLADRMLGRLSKWLRIMGLDCEYVREGTPEHVAEQALDQDRILLTRDTRLLKRKRLGAHLFVASDHLERQLSQVIARYRIDPLARAFTRCIACNQPLKSTTFEEAGSSVPDHVHQTQARLARCPGCRRFYWGATHRDRMRSRLEQLKESNGKGF